MWLCESGIRGDEDEQVRELHLSAADRGAGKRVGAGRPVGRAVDAGEVVREKSKAQSVGKGVSFALEDC